MKKTKNFHIMYLLFLFTMFILTSCSGTSDDFIQIDSSAILPKKPAWKVN